MDLSGDCFIFVSFHYVYVIVLRRLVRDYTVPSLIKNIELLLWNVRHIVAGIFVLNLRFLVFIVQVQIIFIVLSDKILFHVCNIGDFVVKSVRFLISIWTTSWISKRLEIAHSAHTHQVLRRVLLHLNHLVLSVFLYFYFGLHKQHYLSLLILKFILMLQPCALNFLEQRANMGFSVLSSASLECVFVSQVFVLWRQRLHLHLMLAFQVIQ